MSKRYNTYIIAKPNQHNAAARDAQRQGNGATLLVSLGTLVLGTLLAVNLASSLAAPTLF